MKQETSACGKYRKIGPHLYRKPDGARPGDGYTHCFTSTKDKSLAAMIIAYERACEQGD